MPSDSSVSKREGFKRIAHRGASREAPENTLPAIRLAVEKYRVDMVEIDLRLTRDGVPIVLHDPTLERTTNGKGLARNYDLSQIKKLDAGFRGKGITVPTLEEVLAEFPETGFCLEIKDRGDEMVERVCEVILRVPRKGMLLVGSFDGKTARKFRQKAPAPVQSFLSEDEIVWAYSAFRLGFRKWKLAARYASIPQSKYRIRLDEPRWIDFLHHQGVRVFYWTVNEAAEMKKLLEAGADGIVTDNPDLAGVL